MTDLTNRLKESEEKVRRKQDKIDKLKEGSAGKDASKLMVKIELKIKRKEKKKKHKVGCLLETGGGKPEAAPSRPPEATAATQPPRNPPRHHRINKRLSSDGSQRPLRLGRGKGGRSRDKRKCENEDEGRNEITEHRAIPAMAMCTWQQVFFFFAILSDLLVCFAGLGGAKRPNWLWCLIDSRPSPES